MGVQPERVLKELIQPEHKLAVTCYVLVQQLMLLTGRSHISANLHAMREPSMLQ